MDAERVRRNRPWRRQSWLSACRSGQQGNVEAAVGAAVVVPPTCHTQQGVGNDQHLPLAEAQPADGFDREGGQGLAKAAGISGDRFWRKSWRILLNRFPAQPNSKPQPCTYPSRGVVASLPEASPPRHGRVRIAKAPSLGTSLGRAVLSFSRTVAVASAASASSAATAAVARRCGSDLPPCLHCLVRALAASSRQGRVNPSELKRGRYQLPICGSADRDLFCTPAEQLRKSLRTLQDTQLHQVDRLLDRRSGQERGIKLEQAGLDFSFLSFKTGKIWPFYLKDQTITKMT